MLKNNSKYILFLLAILMVSCAKRGNIAGGLKDTLAPILKSSFPKNFSANFKEKEIKFTFDEYIILKDMKKQLIISPPLKYEPLILPTGATKQLSIKISDTLQANTTYSFNFGQSITDNNEGNVLNQFKYVFSTGNYIDSLSLSGTVKDAYNKEIESFISVMLYEINDTFKDSIVYKENPRYITNTLDSLKTFKLENLKAGKYLLVAMKDYNNNNKFNAKTDKIGFKKQYVTVPTDSVQEVKIFKEVLPLTVFKPTQVASNKLLIPYEGKTKVFKVSLKKGDTIVPTIVTKFPKKDSLQIWFKPIKTDSIALSFEQDKLQKDFVYKLRKQKKDTLSISAVQSGVLKMNELFSVLSTTPLVRFDNSKIKLINKDSVAVSFTSKYDEFNQQLSFDFKKDPSERYTLKILPGAMIDFFDKQNDTLSFSINTKALDQYGSLNVNLQNVKQFPVLVELTDGKGLALASQYLEKNELVKFLFLDPNNYSLRVIYDDNKNKEWDSGNYLEKRQAEEVVYFSKLIDIRANWDVEQVFDVSIPYNPEVIRKKKEVKKEENRNQQRRSTF